MMNPAISMMLERYQCASRQDYENALKEIIQEIVLLGLWRSKFFEKAAFYGGTALRIFYRLNRFSEDLDFSLLQPQTYFDLALYNEAVEKELKGFGFEAQVLTKEKTKKSSVQSAFIKVGTLEQLLLINVPNADKWDIHKDQAIKIKIELDINPPQGFAVEAKILLTPIPFSVLVYSPSDLFAGKIHAILCRPWVQRVKGRDWYDLIWYISRRIPVHLAHLRERWIQSEKKELKLNQALLINMLEEKIAATDFEMAKRDVLPFIHDPAALALWSKAFFKERLVDLMSV